MPDDYSEIDLNEHYSLRKDGDMWKIWDKENQLFIEIDLSDLACKK